MERRRRPRSPHLLPLSEQKSNHLRNPPQTQHTNEHSDGSLGSVLMLTMSANPALLRSLYGQRVSDGLMKTLTPSGQHKSSCCQYQRGMNASRGRFCRECCRDSVPSLLLGGFNPVASAGPACSQSGGRALKAGFQRFCPREEQREGDGETEPVVRGCFHVLFDNYFYFFHPFLH